MSILDRLNETYEGLVTGKTKNLNSFVFNETEKSYFSENAVYLGHFLGVLYFFKGEYLLSYSLLKEETNPVSKFYYLYSLICLGYRENAISAFVSGKYEDILVNDFVDANQRLRLAFLLGIEGNPEIKFDQDNREACLLFNLISDFKTYQFDESVSGAIFKSNDSLLINEFKRRKQPQEIIPKLVTHKHFFDDGFLTLYSNSTFIGNNMYLLKIGHTCIIVDCGADTKDSYIDFEQFFKTCKVDKTDISAVFFTHAHLDHIGNSLNLLKYLGNSVDYYLTIDTQNLAAYGNQVFLEGRKLKYISYNTTVQITDKLSATFIQNGHILGSTALIFNYDGKSILYTSDFCLHDQPTVKGINLYQISSFVGDKIDYLITESTYGHKADTIDYEDSVWLLQKVSALLGKYGKRIFFPAYAIGRTQEIISILLDSNQNAKLNVLGSANNVTLHYIAIGRCINKHFYSDRENTTDYDVTIASSGMLLDGSESNLFMKKILNEPSQDIAVIQTGYLPPAQEGTELISAWKNKGRLYFNISLSAHASNAEIHKLIDSFKVENIISIHGDGIE